MKKNNLKQLILLQLVVIIYTCSGIMAKFASTQKTLVMILLYFFLDLCFLGVYAIFWQQMIKKMPLSVAYLNRAMSLAWSSLWAVIIFKEDMTVRKLLAVTLVTVGIIIVNSEDGGKKVEIN